MVTVCSNCMGGRTKEDAVEIGTEGALAEFPEAATDGADLFWDATGITKIA